MKRIVIAGAGFGGIACGLTLARVASGYEIVLLNDTPYHSFHADLYEVATAILEKEHKIDFTHLEGTVNIPLKKIFAPYSTVKVVVDSITKIDSVQKKVSTEKSDFFYDVLVIALGSITCYFSIPGAKEYSHPFKTTEDALNIRNDIEELVMTKVDPVTVAVAGGGLSGVEVSSQMKSFIHNAASKHKKKQGRVVILERSSHVMAGTPAWAQEYGLSLLKKRGVEVELDTTIIEVTKDKILCEQEKTIEYDYLIWTTGTEGNSLEGKIEGIGLTKRNQIEVSQYLTVEGKDEVYAIGDVASFTDPLTQRPVPSTAWAAIAMGKHAGENIVQGMQGHHVFPFVPKPPAFVVPLGKKQGVAVVGSMRLYGFVAWVLKRIVSLKYFLSVLPFFLAIDTWRKGVKLYIKND